MRISFKYVLVIMFLYCLPISAVHAQVVPLPSPETTPSLIEVIPTEKPIPTAEITELPSPIPTHIVIPPISNPEPTSLITPIVLESTPTPTNTMNNIEVSINPLPVQSECQTTLLTPRIESTESGIDSIAVWFDPLQSEYKNIDILYGMDENKLDLELFHLGHSATRMMRIFMLSEDTTYFIKLRLNGMCSTSDWSNVVSARTSSHKPEIASDDGTVAGVVENHDTDTTFPTLTPSTDFYDVQLQLKDELNHEMKNVRVTVPFLNKTQYSDTKGEVLLEQIPEGDLAIELLGPNIMALYTLSINGPTKSLSIILNVQKELSWWQKPQVWIASILGVMGIGIVLDGFIRSRKRAMNVATKIKNAGTIEAPA
ncbi:hypothetical protein HGA91_05410 [candidate division WWE3 bacterium]|nr:hypothetical protein [candidate division WWE3 bacterium]